MAADRDMGLEPPSVSKKTLDYLRRGSGVFSSLADLRAFIGDCRRCNLSKGRNHLVFGEGSPEARLVFVGEGPGREEDLEGRPFVGEAGKLLTDIIQKGMKLRRESVYICNVVKCRPPNNRDPEPEEIETCLPFLKKQIDIIRPEVICTLGRIAGQTLLKKEFRITRERGKWHRFNGIPVMPTFHPAYVIRNRSRERELKGMVWEDIKRIMEKLGLEI
jgi:DNA polymerase